MSDRSRIQVVATVIILTALPGTRAVAHREAQNAQGADLIYFEERQRGSGIAFVLKNDATQEKHIIEDVLGGLALLDFDRDDFLDIYFTNGARIPELRKSNSSFSNRLYRNNRDGTFTDVTERAGVAGYGYDMGAAPGDFNRDGWVDLFVAGVDRNVLYRNRGDGTFEDVTERAGVSGRQPGGHKPWSVAAAWLDYDNDGKLDLFVVNYLDWSFAVSRLCGDPGKRLSCPPTLYRGLPNLLYHNNGDGTFRDVTLVSGIGRHVGKGMSAAVADYDRDGFVDIFVTNDRERNFLFHNQGGRAFEEVGVEAAVALPDSGVPVSSMGADFRDLDGDGFPDLVLTALASETFPLFINGGSGSFTDQTYRAQLGFATMTMSGWGLGAYDFDNDGNKDLFFANSHVHDNIEFYFSHLRSRLPNAVFRNLGNGTYRNVSLQAGAALEPARAHRGVAFGDLNNDGRIDVVVSAIGQEPAVLLNASPAANHWIVLDLDGTRSNRDGIGTWVKITGESGFVAYNHATTAVGYASGSDRRVHFGLGRDRRLRTIEIHWPSGRVQVLEGIPADRILRVKER